MCELEELKLKLGTSDGLEWYVLEDTKIDKYIIPKGFETDGASIPRILWSITGCPIKGKYSIAAVLHDYLYSREANVSFEDANKAFYRNMRRTGVSKFKAKYMYLAVKYFGKLHYHKGQ